MTAKKTSVSSRFTTQAFVFISLLTVTTNVLFQMQMSSVNRFSLQHQKESFTDHLDVGKPHHLQHPWQHHSIHTITSRFMQSQSKLKHLTHARFLLFKTFCLPSIVGQSVMVNYINQLSNATTANNMIDPPFLWFIKVDPELDRSVLNKMIDLVKPYPNIYIIDNLLPMHNYWKEEGTLRELLQYNPTPHTGDFAMLKRAFSWRNKYISLETRLDADDGLHKGYIERIQDEASSRLRAGSKVNWTAWCVK